MTRKFKYHLQENKFEELPGMEEPNVDDEVDENIEGTYKERCIWYLQHIESLHDGKHNPMIPGSPECREVFEDGQVVLVGIDVEIYTDIPKGWMPSYVNPPDDAPIITEVVPKKKYHITRK